MLKLNKSTLAQWSLAYADVWLMLAAMLSRLIPHPSNVTPLGALWLFAGAQSQRRRALVWIPLLALVLSDLVLGYYFVWPYVYGSYAIAYLIGRFGIRSTPGSARVLSGTLLSACLFYLITNFGEWLHSSLYPHTAAGLVTCYVAALPFFRNSLLGDLSYAGVIFGSYALMERVYRERRLWVNARF